MNRQTPEQVGVPVSEQNIETPVQENDKNGQLPVEGTDIDLAPPLEIPPGDTDSEKEIIKAAAVVQVKSADNLLSDAQRKARATEIVKRPADTDEELTKFATDTYSVEK